MVGKYGLKRHPDVIKEVNLEEFTSKDDIEAGGNTLLRLILDIAGG